MIVYARDRSVALPRRKPRHTHPKFKDSFQERNSPVIGAYRSDDGKPKLPSLMEQHVLRNTHGVLKAERERKEARKAKRRAVNINKQAILDSLM